MTRSTAKLSCRRRERYECTLHARTTINAQDLAVDPPAVLRGEETDDARNVDGKTDAVGRGPAGGVLESQQESSGGRGTYLVNFVVLEGVAAGDILPADGVVHVRLDAAGGNGVDGDFLVAKVCGVSVSVPTRGKDTPMAMQRTNVSMAPLLPE